MIYCIEPKLYPDKDNYIEELIYKDQNDLEWRIARVRNGFMVRYFGHEYFKENVFSGELKNGRYFKIKNTNCIFFENSEFDTFCDVRDALITGYTDDIWELFEDLFIERFNISSAIIESEII